MEPDWVLYLPVLMFLALAAGLFTGFPVAFVAGGVALAFGLIGWTFGVFSLIEFYNIVPRTWSGAMENPVLVAVPCFIFMGVMLERSGIADDLLRILQILLRRVPGGLALSVTVMGTIMAATTGIIGASVVMMTLMALPTMLRQNYRVELATGTLAAASTLGILIPPSIMLVIMADMLSVSVGNLFVGAFLPGLLLSGLYAVYILTVSALRPEWAPPVPEDAAPETARDLLSMVARGFLPPVLLIVLVLGSILGGWATPTEAAGVGGAGALALARFNRRLDRRVLADSCNRTAMTAGMICMMFIGASAFSYVFRSLGGEDLIVDTVRDLGLGSWGVLFILMATVFVLGFFFDWFEITLIVLPVFTPIVALLDFGGHVAGQDIVYWFAILVAINLQTSFLTPPFGFALFFMKAVAPPTVTIQHIYRGIVPFVLLQLAGLLAVATWPELALWLPRVLLD